MGLFDKREKMNLETASGVVFMMSMVTEGRMAQMELDEIEKDHEIAVRCGYDFGLSMALLGSQIGLNGIDEFINLAIKNAKDTLTPEAQSNISEYEKYIRKATNWVINESTNHGNDLFEAYAKEYLNDLYEEKPYSGDILNIATQDMMFYYGNWQKVAGGIKIVK